MQLLAPVDVSQLCTIPRCQTRLEQFCSLKPSLAGRLYQSTKTSETTRRCRERRTNLHEAEHQRSLCAGRRDLPGSQKLCEGVTNLHELEHLGGLRAARAQVEAAHAVAQPPRHAAAILVQGEQLRHRVVLRICRGDQVREGQGSRS